jgi:hypothetical protein
VQTFPAGKGKWQISTGGGVEARWSGDGRELYYIQRGKVMAAGIAMKAGSLEVASTKELFQFRHGHPQGTSLAVSADGKTFAVRESSEAGLVPITIKLGWKLPRAAD